MRKENISNIYIHIQKEKKGKLNLRRQEEKKRL